MGKNAKKAALRGKGLGSVAELFVASNANKATEQKSVVATGGDEDPNDNVGNLLAGIDSKLKGLVKTPAELEEEMERGLRNAKMAEDAAQLLVTTRNQIAAYKQMIKEGSQLSLIKLNHLKELEEVEQQLLNLGDSELQKHREFSEFLVEIRMADPSLKKAEGFMQKAIKWGRYHQASNDEVKMILSLRKEKKPFPQGSIYFNGINYLPNEGEGAVKTKGQMALEVELDRFVRRSVKAEIEKENASTEVDLTSLKKGSVGKYKIIFEERMGDNGKKYSAGEGVVEIRAQKMDKGPVDQKMVMAPVKGYGSLKIFSDLAKENFWIPAYWYGEDLSKKTNVSDSLRKNAITFLKIVKAGVAAFYSREKGGDD